MDHWENINYCVWDGRRICDDNTMCWKILNIVSKSPPSLQSLRQDFLKLHLIWGNQNGPDLQMHLNVLKHNLFKNKFTDPNDRWWACFGTSDWVMYSVAFFLQRYYAKLFSREVLQEKGRSFCLTIIMCKKRKISFKGCYWINFFLQACWMQFLNNTEARCIDYNKIRKCKTFFPKKKRFLGPLIPLFLTWVTSATSFKTRLNCFVAPWLLAHYEGAMILRFIFTFFSFHIPQATLFLFWEMQFLRM